jgi:hypothetical protein
MGATIARLEQMGNIAPASLILMEIPLRGWVGFIVSRAFLEAVKATKLRKYLADSDTVSEIFDFGNHRVFPKVGIATAMLFLRCEARAVSLSVSKVINKIESHEETPEYLQESPDILRFSLKRASLSERPWHLSPPGRTSLYRKIDANGEELSAFMTLGQGMQTGANTVFGKKTATALVALGVTKAQSRRRVRNSDILAYGLKRRDEHLLYFEDVKSFKELSPGIQRYLKENEKKLKDRAAFKRGNCEWWKYTWPLQKDLYSMDRIICPYLASHNRFVVLNDFIGLGLTDTTVIFDSDQRESIKYICCILNSSVLTYRFFGIGKLKGGGIYEYFSNSVGNLPIRRIAFGDANDVAAHDLLVSDYDAIAALMKRAALTVSDRRQLATLKARVDRTVSGLYGLSSAEVAEIAAATSSAPA